MSHIPCLNHLEIGDGWINADCTLARGHVGLHKSRTGTYSWGAVIHSSGGICEESIGHEGTHRVCGKAQHHDGRHCSRFVLMFEGELGVDPFPVQWLSIEYKTKRAHDEEKQRAPKQEAFVADTQLYYRQRSAMPPTPQLSGNPRRATHNTKRLVKW